MFCVSPDRRAGDSKATYHPHESDDGCDAIGGHSASIEACAAPQSPEMSVLPPLVPLFVKVVTTSHVAKTTFGKTSRTSERYARFASQPAQSSVIEFV